MKNIRPVVYVKSNEEIAKFKIENELIINKACSEAQLRHSDWDYVLGDMLVKYATGKLDYNPAFNAKYSTYIYTVALHCAIDAVRRLHTKRFQDLEGKDWDNFGDKRDNNSKSKADDENVVVTEAIRRLAKEMRDKTKVEILVRSVLNRESREKLADEYDVESDYISLVKTRYLPRFQNIVREVLREEKYDTIKLSNTDIAFLKPHMNW